MNKKPGLNDKRNYIRRKKYLQDCALHIKAAIDLMSIVKNGKINNEESEKQATLYAQQIEAVCWSPRSQMSAENYQKLMQTKTREFTCTILKKTLPFLDINQLQKIASTLILEHIQHQNSLSPINLDLLKSIQLNLTSDNSKKIDSNSSQLNENISQIKKEPTSSISSNISKPFVTPVIDTKSGIISKQSSNENSQQEKQKQKKISKKSENSMEIRFPISASDIMSIFEFGDGTPSNPYFIPNVENENVEEKNELYPILFESDAIFPSDLSLDINESITDSFIDSLIL